MSRLDQNLTDAERRERARRWRERRRAAVRRYEQKLRESGASKYRSIGSNRERRRKRFERAYESESRVRWTKRLPCTICRACPSEVAHVRSRAAGGTAADTVPLCRQHHRESHAMGIESFQRFYNVDLAAEARAVDEAWRERQG